MRVTVIGEQVFSVAISGSDRLDWRTTLDLEYTPTEVPPAVLAGIREYLRRYGLEYGAFDFICTADTGAWFFLECNPSGMYGFVEIKSGLEVTAAIADRLCQPMRG